MKQYFGLYVALAATLSLGACASSGTNTTPTSITSFEQIIQQDAQAICSFVPTLASVAAIVGAVVPGATADTTVASSIATQICTAVASVASTSLKAGTTAAPAIYYPGTMIPIHGTFVSKLKAKKR
jgi:hypothetical protein